MGERRKTGEPPRGPLVEGRRRLESLVRSLKSNQLARTRAKVGPQPPVSEAFVLSPDEAWAEEVHDALHRSGVFSGDGGRCARICQIPGQTGFLG